MQPSEREPFVSQSMFSFSISLVLTGFVLFFALANSISGLAAVTAGIIILMSATRLWAALSLARLGAEVGCDKDRLFPDEDFEIRVDLENRKPLPVWIGLELPAPRTFAPAEGGENARGLRSETGLLPFEKLSGRWSYVVKKRGVYSLGPMVLRSGDLLGLHRKEKTLAFRKEIVVYPRLRPITGPELSFREYFGIHPSKGLVEDPAWYAGTRDYSGTRPAKNIHWKASARLDSLQEKIFEPTSHRKVFFLLDGHGFLRNRDDQEFETTLEIVASLAARSAETGASFGMATNFEVVNFAPLLPLGRGPEHLGRLLELLARIRPEAGENIISLLERGGICGVGYVVCAREVDEKTRRYFDLPSARRNRMIFLFARESPDGASKEYPACYFREILPSGTERS